VPLEIVLVLVARGSAVHDQVVGGIRELLIGIAIGAGTMALLAGASASSLQFAALILACPLMMLFMGHGGHDHDAHDAHPPKDSVRNAR
jgi:hypothetical protein